ncbi:hypothetical protein C8Q74DRAFT_1445748 [Fomes fomentarius]|nr:hypothetical protein C8Q74DRAFT_1445748 [Fomes fomentarius]
MNIPGSMSQSGSEIIQRQSGERREARESGLKSQARADSLQGDRIGVVISVDKDEETALAERDKEAVAKRKQNTLQLWHLQSTVCGDLTALGIEESACAEAVTAVDVNKLLSSNDAMLKRRRQITTTSHQYYASLACVDCTPGQLTSEYGGEEEDVKPNLEYLDSLNDRKRSRSRQDVGAGGSTPKMPRTDEHMETQNVAAPQDVEVYTNGVGGDSGDDPIVYVNDAPVPLSQITEEHQEAMSPEEYAYFEVLTARTRDGDIVWRSAEGHGRCIIDRAGICDTIMYH